MVLLVTCYYQDNYGSKLQAYATQEILNELNVDNKTVNYSELSGYMNKVKIRYYFSNIKNFDAFKAQFNRYSFKFIVKLNSKLKKYIRNRYNAMKKFEKSKFILTDAYEFESLDQMCMDYKADAVIVGSDQLWLPSNIYANYYTLGFVPDDIKRISYATSFGVSSLDENTNTSLNRFIEKFSSISVREKSGCDIIKKASEKKVDLVCDPTLLFCSEKWEKLLNLKPVINDEYIFCYFLGNNPWQREWVKELKKMTGLKIVSLVHLESYMKCDTGYADELPFDVGPEEFVSLIKNAKYVCTDSFHGTVFSLLFHKEFFTFKRFTDKHSVSTNSRLYSLFELLNIHNRMISDNISASEALKLTMNYSEIDSKLENFRNDSAEWLKKALGVN